MNREDFYQNILCWILEQKKNFASNRPLLLGISGPQGSGKTTLSTELVTRLSSKGLKAICVSIDDFYLTRKEQQKLTDTTSNPFLKQRGYPGTHNVDLGEKTLLSLKNAETTLIPSYDKSKFEGNGDRLPTTEWPKVDEAQDVVILEGWMLGFVPQDKVSDLHLLEVNEKLKQYDTWLKPLDAFLYLEPEELAYVIDWRIEAERNMRASSKPSMSDEGVKSYVEKFIPAYKLYAPTVPSRSAQFKAFKTFKIQKSRLPG